MNHIGCVLKRRHLQVILQYVIGDFPCIGLAIESLTACPGQYSFSFPNCRGCQCIGNNAQGTLHILLHIITFESLVNLYLTCLKA